MNFKLSHTNLNVLNMERSVAFYQEALGMRVVRTKESSDNSFVLKFLSDADGVYQIELTELRDRTDPYDLGDNETHICFETDDYEAAHKLHSDMGCICFENKGMGLYFIEDPDGYWIEIVREKNPPVNGPSGADATSTTPAQAKTVAEPEPTAGVKASVDRDICIGCGLCCEICPSVFVMDDDQIANVIVPVVPEDQIESARDAASSCPVNAITLTE